MRQATLITCSRCGMQFVYGVKWQEQNESHHMEPPSLCHQCWKDRIEERQALLEKEEKLKNQQIKEAEWRENQHKFLDKLKLWNVVPMESIHPDESKTLFILGNGFDMMHGVRSSYYSFRDSMKKEDPVRKALEEYFDVPDLWANLEESLAHFDLNRMCNGYAMDANLEISGAYEDESHAAEFCMAMEMAVEPLRIVAVDLPKKFRTWINSLEVGTDSRPLSGMFGGGGVKVLCFNYTEFVEDMYGVNYENICYIHGCRKKTKNKARENLILGHLPELSDSAYELEKDNVWKKNPYNRSMVRAAQEQAICMAHEYDEMFTKRCQDILRDKKTFFESLVHVQNVVVVGHSLSKVDWDYFEEAKKSIESIQNVKWYVGCYGLDDINRLEEMCAKNIIRRESVLIFRTDQIKVELTNKVQPQKKSTNRVNKEKILAVSSDHSIVVKADRNIFSINDKNKHLLKLRLQSSAMKAVFISNEKRLFLRLYGINSALYLFSRDDSGWSFVNEICPPGEYRLFNQRLKYIYVDDCDINFVYNNRLYQYDLNTGDFKKNVAGRNMRFRHFEGEDILPEIGLN